MSDLGRDPESWSDATIEAWLREKVASRMEYLAVRIEAAKVLALMKRNKIENGQ